MLQVGYLLELEWRELDTVKLHDFYCSPNIIWVMCRHVAWVDEKGNTGVWWGNLKEGYHMEDVGYRWEGSIDTRAWTGFAWPRIWTNVGLVT